MSYKNSSRLSLFKGEQSLALSGGRENLLIFHDIDQFLAALRAADHQNPNQPVLPEEQLAIIFVALLAWLAQRDRLKLWIVGFGGADHGDIHVEERTGVGRNIEIRLPIAGHIEPGNSSVRHRVIPCTHRMVLADGDIVE